MVVFFTLLLLIQTGSVGDEIVIVAKSKKCDLAAAGLTLRESEFKVLAGKWAAGRPVRIIVPTGMRTKCLAKIMFKLHDHGVTRAEFVDAPSYH